MTPKVLVYLDWCEENIHLLKRPNPRQPSPPAKMYIRALKTNGVVGHIEVENAEYIWGGRGWRVLTSKGPLSKLQVFLQVAELMKRTPKGSIGETLGKAAMDSVRP